MGLKGTLKRKGRPDEEVVSLLREVGIDTPSVRHVRARGVDDAWVVRLARALPGSSVRHLDLADNDVRESGAMAISGALKSGAQLESLSLSGAKHVRLRGVRAIAEVLSDNKTLRHLDLSWCSAAGGSEEVVAALGHNDTLESLNVAGVRFRGADFSGLGQNRTLRRLDVRCTYIRRIPSRDKTKRLPNNEHPLNHQARHLLEAIDENTTLEELDLGIRNQGVCDVVEVLATHPSITRLNLNGTAFRNKHAAALGRALSKNTTLRHLSLANNSIGCLTHDQLQCFLNGLSESALMSLDMSNTQWAWYSGECFFHKIFRSRLRHLNLRGICYAREEVREHRARAVKRAVLEHAARSLEEGTFALESLEVDDDIVLPQVVLRALESNNKKNLRCKTIDEIARKRGREGLRWDGRLRPWDLNLSLLIIAFAGPEVMVAPPLRTTDFDYYNLNVPVGHHDGWVDSSRISL